jgi:putative ABC transport system permease protein
MKSQVLAIAMVMASGVAVFVMSQATLTSLRLTQETYYVRYRFADIFAHLRRAPNSVKAQIEEVPNVNRVQTRVVEDVILDVADFAEPVVGRILGISAEDPRGLNQLHLRKGRLIESGHDREVVVHEAFADAHGLQPGATISAILNGHKEQLHVVGIVLSPEFVYAIRPGELLPDDRRFGVLWMGQNELAAVFDLEGAFNDVSLAMMPGAIEQEVIQRLDDILARYGGTGAYSRMDQSSHKVLSSELTQLRSMAIVFPMISLCVAGFLLHVVLSRMIATQREEIATLKAFGYTRSEIGIHYLKFLIVVLCLGILVGTVVGIWLARDLAALYVRYFRFPVFLFRLAPATVFIAFGLCALAAVLGAWNAVQRAVRLPPADAMKPEPPASFRATIVERLGVQRFFSPAWRMVFRYIERQPVRSILTCLGVALATAVLILGSFIEDSVNYVMDFQFNLAQRQDVTIGFVDPLSATAMHDVRHLPAVFDAQPFRSVPARLRCGYRVRRIAILGLPDDRRLYRVVDVRERELDLPDEGLILSSKAADLLHLKVGDSVTVEVLEGERAIRRATVTGLVNDFGEPTAYMNLNTLRRLLREGDQISGAFLATDSSKLATLHKQLKETPKVASVGVKSAALTSFRKLFAEHLLRMRTFDVVFACIMVFGVVYNSARVSLSERSRDLATLRVMGFTRGEIFRILLGELSILVVAAIPLGLIMGYYFSAVAIWALETETQRFPLVIEKSTYGFATIVVIAATFLSAAVVRRRLNQLDLVAVLKARE